MTSHPTSAFGALLRQLRRSAGLTQVELAERCRLRRESIGILEREDRVPRRGTVAMLAAALGLEGVARAQFASAAAAHRAEALTLRVEAHAPYRVTSRVPVTSGGAGNRRAIG